MPRTHPAARLSERELVDEVERNFVEAFSRFGQIPGAELHREPGLTWVLSLPFPPYSGVLETRLGETEVREALDRIDLYYRVRGAQYFWMVGSSSTPPSLRPLLRSRGFVIAEPLTGMVAPLAALPEVPRLPAGVTILEVRDIVGEREYARQQIGRWDIPPAYAARIQEVHAFVSARSETMRRWIAYRDEVGVGKVFLFLGSRTAAIYGVAVAPELRGSGVGTALTLTAFEAARRAGYELGVLHSSVMAYGLYERLGFRAVCQLEPFVEPREGGHTVSP